MRGRAARTLLASLLIASAGSPLAAGDANIGATDILYMQAADWHQLQPERKLALSEAFMRIFCTDGRMAPESLMLCLDHDARRDRVFERAIDCAASLSRG